MIMNTKEAAHRLRMATIGKTGYEHTPVSVDALRIVLDALDRYRGAQQIAQPECKHCDDTGSLSKSLEGQYDCHHCGRADENVRVLKWYEGTHLDTGSEADVLNIYYHGKAAVSQSGGIVTRPDRERIAELEREVAANRQQIAQLDRELSAERMVHGATKRLKEQLDAQLQALKAAPSPADNGGGKP